MKKHIPSPSPSYYSGSCSENFGCSVCEPAYCSLIARQATKAYPATFPYPTTAYAAGSRFCAYHNETKAAVNGRSSVACLYTAVWRQSGKPYGLPAKASWRRRRAAENNSGVPTAVSMPPRARFSYYDGRRQESRNMLAACHAAWRVVRMAAMAALAALFYQRKA